MSDVIFNASLVRSRIMDQYGSLARFAAVMGWSRQYLSRVLSGKSGVSLSRLAELSSALGLPLSALMPSDTAGEESRLLRESREMYVVRDAARIDIREHTPYAEESEPNIIIDADHFIDVTPWIRIEDLPLVPEDWGEPGPKLSEEERLALVDELTGKYRDLLPSSEEFMKRKQEEKAKENAKRYGLHS